MFDKNTIIQAPMAGIQDAELTIAVCKAGGIGSLAAAMLSPSQLAAEIEKIQIAVANRPYNINFFAHKIHSITADQRQQWLSLLSPYFEKYQIDTDTITNSAGRNPFDENALAILQKYRPPIVSFHFGLPEAKLLNEVKSLGIKIWSSATTVEEAQWLEAQGVDAIIAQGLEAGGHRGMFLTQDLHTQQGLFALLPQIVANVRCPVIAAGGICDYTTVLAAKNLGASAVQVGTAFLLAKECKTSAVHREALLAKKEKITALTNIFSGGLARGIITPFMRELGMINAKALPFPYAGTAINCLKTVAIAQGDNHFSSFWAGQNVALIKPGTAAEIIQRLLHQE